MTTQTNTSLFGGTPLDQATPPHIITALPEATPMPRPPLPGIHFDSHQLNIILVCTVLYIVFCNAQFIVQYYNRSLSHLCRNWEIMWLMWHIFITLIISLQIIELIIVRNYVACWGSEFVSFLLVTVTRVNGRSVLLPLVSVARATIMWQSLLLTCTVKVLCAKPSENIYHGR